MSRVELRDELLPPAVPPERLAEVSRRIEEITDLVLQGHPAEDAIQAFDDLTGRSYDIGAFAEHQASRSLEEFAMEAARPRPGRVPGITREELAEIVRRIIAAGPDTDHYVELFEANVPHPRASGLIFWPPDELWNASAEQIVDAALAYRPIAL